MANWFSWGRMRDDVIERLSGHALLNIEVRTLALAPGIVTMVKHCRGAWRHRLPYVSCRSSALQVGVPLGTGNGASGTYIAS